MDETEMKTFHSRREDLFPTKLPYSAITAINAQLRSLEAERADRALVAYSKAKPYRGFYLLKFMVWYERAGDGERRPPFSGTDTALRRGAAPATNDGGDDSYDAERREREAYAALPPEYVLECETLLADWGWPIGSRGWRIMCLDRYIGRDIERYRIHPAFGSAEYDRDLERKRARAEYERLGLETAVARLRARLAQLGESIDVIA